MTQPPPGPPRTPPPSGSPYGQPPYGQPPYGPPPYWMRRPTNQNAIVALVLALILPPLGIYFGGKARREIAVTGEEGSGLATAGVVIGWVWTGLIASIMLIFCLSFAVPVLLLIFGSGIDVPNPDPSPSFPFPSPTGTPSPLPS